jgi:hypothetical protein
MGESFNTPIAHHPPLKRLCVGKGYTHPLVDLPQLTHLEFIEYQQEKIHTIVPPPTLTHFSTGNDLYMFGEAKVIPPTWEFPSLTNFMYYMYTDEDTHFRFRYTENLTRLYFAVISRTTHNIETVVDINFKTCVVTVSFRILFLFPLLGENFIPYELHKRTYPFSLIHKISKALFVTIQVDCEH